jgi:hypothetical protein
MHTQTRNEDAEKRQASGCHVNPNQQLVSNTLQCIASTMTHNNRQYKLLNSNINSFHSYTSVI